MYKDYIQINRVIRRIIRKSVSANELNMHDENDFIKNVTVDHIEQDIRELEILWPKDLDKSSLENLKNNGINKEGYLSVELYEVEDAIDKYFQEIPAGDIQKSVTSYLHPIVIDSSYNQFKNGHFRDAVFNSVVAVFDLIRDITNIDKDGADLINYVFSLDKPKLILTELNTESGQNDQKGFMQIFRGAYQGIRNPKAHSLETDLNERNTAQYLIFTSLLARRIEESEQNNIEN